jgi:hypothetical protein
MGGSQDNSIFKNRSRHPIRLSESRKGTGAIRKDCRKVSTNLVSVNGQDAVVPVNGRSLTRTEARSLVERIRSHINNARALVLELYEKEGWKALGYNSWRECVVAEFDQSQAHLYRLLKAAEVERNISPIGENGKCTIVQNAEPICEAVLRPLASLEPEQQREVWASATAIDPNPTAAQVEKAVESIRSKQGARSRVSPQDLARIEAEERERQQRERATILFYQCVLLFDPCAMGVEALTDHLLAVVDLKILPERLLKERLQQCSTVFSAIASKWE